MAKYLLFPGLILAVLTSACSPAEHLGREESGPSQTSTSSSSSASSLPASPLSLQVTTMSSYLLLPGSGFTAKISLKAEKDFSDLTLQAALVDSAQVEVTSRSLTGQSLNLGETKEFTFNYLLAESLPSGSYNLILKVRTAQGVEILSRPASTFLVRSPIRIAAGRTTNYVDAQGQIWEADRGFFGSSYATQLADTVVGGTQDPELYKTFRVANVGASFYYQLEVPGPGNYKLRLRNCESWVNGAAQRLFNVTVNGLRVLENYDIFVDAGGKFLAKDRDFTTTALLEGGKYYLRVQFDPILENPKIHAIEILGAP